MAILEIKNPVAAAHVRWLTASEGGRVSGPPTAPVYSATAVFSMGGEAETIPGWPASADQLSILVQLLGSKDGDEEISLIGFLVPDLAKPNLRPGAEMLILEGPKVVAELTIDYLVE